MSETLSPGPGFPPPAPADAERHEVLPEIVSASRVVMYEGNLTHHPVCEDRVTCRDDIRVYGAADGMGGEGQPGDGAVASGFVAHNIERRLEAYQTTNPEGPTSVDEAIETMRETFHGTRVDFGRMEIPGGTVLTYTWITKIGGKPYLVWGHAGDTGLKLLRDGATSVIDLTADHGYGTSVYNGIWGQGRLQDVKATGDEYTQSAGAERQRWLEDIATRVADEVGDTRADEFKTLVLAGKQNEAGVNPFDKGTYTFHSFDEAAQLAAAAWLDTNVPLYNTLQDDFGAVELGPGDRFALLSDGVTGDFHYQKLTPEEILDAMSQPTPDESAQRFIDLSTGPMPGESTPPYGGAPVPREGKKDDKATVVVAYSGGLEEPEEIKPEPPEPPEPPAPEATAKAREFLSQERLHDATPESREAGGNVRAAARTVAGRLTGPDGMSDERIAAARDGVALQLLRAGNAERATMTYAPLGDAELRQLLATVQTELGKYRKNGHELPPDLDALATINFQAAHLRKLMPGSAEYAQELARWEASPKLGGIAGFREAQQRVAYTLLDSLDQLSADRAANPGYTRDPWALDKVIDAFETTMAALMHVDEKTNIEPDEERLEAILAGTRVRGEGHATTGPITRMTVEEINMLRDLTNALDNTVSPKVPVDGKMVANPEYFKARNAEERARIVLARELLPADEMQRVLGLSDEMFGHFVTNYEKLRGRRFNQIYQTVTLPRLQALGLNTREIARILEQPSDGGPGAAGALAVLIRGAARDQMGGAIEVVVPPPHTPV